MISGKRVLCVIPARGGSKGLPRKNLRLLGGRPLIAYTIETAASCEEIDRTIVSTDDQEIAETAKSLGAEVPFLRPAELARDDSSTIDVLLHAMGWVETHEGRPYDIVLLLHVTAPLRRADDVGACLRLVAVEGAPNAFTVTPAHANPYFNMVEADESGVRLCKQGSFAGRQNAPEVFEINGAAYAWEWDVLRNQRAVLLPDTRLHVMPRDRSVDIDAELDLRVAECLLCAR